MRTKLKSILGMDAERLLMIFAITLLIVSFGFKIFVLFNSAPGFDEAGVSYMAEEMNSGRQLYSEVFDHKPPFMHYLLSFIFRFVDASTFSIRGIAFVFDILFLITVFFVSRKLIGKKYALFAAAVSSVFNMTIALEAEILVGMFGLWALFFYVKAIEKENITNFNLFLSGIFVAISIWFKQTAVFFYIPVIAHLIYLSYKNKISRKDAVKGGILFTLGALVLSLPLLSYFLIVTKGYFLYALLKFNLEFNASTSRLMQIGKGLGILLTYLGFLLAISLSKWKENANEKNCLGSSLIMFSIFNIIFLFFQPEIFYQHIFQVMPFLVLLGILTLKNSDNKLKWLMVLIMIIALSSIVLTNFESKAREIRAGDIDRETEVISHLDNNVPTNSSFFSDNPKYSLLGGYKLNQSLIGIAPSFASVFDYSFICNLDYLVLTHRQNFLNDDEKECIKKRYTLMERFENIGESFVEVYKSKNL